MRILVKPFLVLLAGGLSAALALGACGSKQQKKTTPVADRSRGGSDDRKPVTTEVKPSDGSAGLPAGAIYFEFDSYQIRADSKPALEKIAAYMEKNAGASVTISGHTDDRGTTEYNLALGDQRAKAARDYLVRLGVDAGRIKIISYGEERPAVQGQTEEAWSRNRRDEFDTTTTR